MSNNYETVTLTRDLPRKGISAVQESILKAFGFEVESVPRTNPDSYENALDAALDAALEDDDEDDCDYVPSGLDHGEGDDEDDDDDGDYDDAPDAEFDDKVYVYSESPCDPADSILGMSDSEVEAALALWETHPVGQRLIENDFTNVSVEEIFQDILRGLDRERYPHLDLLAGYWCDKARPGEFGGWAMRIWPDAIKFLHAADEIGEAEHPRGVDPDINRRWLKNMLKMGKYTYEELIDRIVEAGLQSPEEFVLKARKTACKELDKIEKRIRKRGFASDDTVEVPYLDTDARAEYIEDVTEWMLRADARLKASAPLS